MLPIVEKPVRRDAFADAFADRDGPFAAGAWQQQRELVAAEARHHVGLAGADADDARGLDQRPAAEQVAVRVVDGSPSSAAREDFNGDGRADLRLYFYVAGLSVRPETTRLAVRGRTCGGLPVGGADDVIVILVNDPSSTAQNGGASPGGPQGHQVILPDITSPYQTLGHITWSSRLRSYTPITLIGGYELPLKPAARPIFHYNRPLK